MTRPIVLDGKVKPATKAEAYSLVLAWARGEQLHPDAVQRVLLFFAAPRVKVPKNAWGWVGLFACPGEKSTAGREYLQGIHCDGVHAFASDGVHAFASDGKKAAWIECDKPKGVYHARTGLLVSREFWNGFSEIFKRHGELFNEVPELVDLATAPCEVVSPKVRLYQLRELYYPADQIEAAFSRGVASIYSFGAPGNPPQPLAGQNDFGRFLISPYLR